jgi:hypothetical protein
LAFLFIVGGDANSVHTGDYSCAAFIGLLHLGSDRRDPVALGSFCENQLGEKRRMICLFTQWIR